MKPKILTYVIFLITVFYCNVYSQELILDNINSSIKWTGKEITTKTHYGSLKFEEGKISMKGKNIISGKFIVDLKSIDCEDLSGKSKN